MIRIGNDFIVRLVQFAFVQKTLERFIVEFFDYRMRRVHKFGGIIEPSDSQPEVARTKKLFENRLIASIKSNNIKTLWN